MRLRPAGYTLKQTFQIYYITSRDTVTLLSGTRNILNRILTFANRSSELLKSGSSEKVIFYLKGINGGDSMYLMEFSVFSVYMHTNNVTTNKICAS